MKWIDSHCHLASLSGGAEEAIRRAREAGVAAMICVGTDLESSLRACDLADRHLDVAATVGLHPHDASKLAAQWGQLEALSAAAPVVAVGETGFDLHYEHSPRDEQEAAFRVQIRLAKRRGVALVVHTREAWDETFRVLLEEGMPERTIFHCFTGGPEEARRALDLGAYLSFSGIVSFKTADAVRAAAAITPLDRMLVETDAPFLAPAPHRGEENEPAFVTVVGAALAAAIDRPEAEIAEATRVATRSVFAL